MLAALTPRRAAAYLCLKVRIMPSEARCAHAQVLAGSDALAALQLASAPVPVLGGARPAWHAIHQAYAQGLQS